MISSSRIAAIFVCMAVSVVFAEVESSSGKPNQEVPVEVRDARLIYKNALAYRGDVKPLGRIFARAEEGGEVKIAVVGGSITEGARASCVEKRWANRFVAGWQELFPKAKIVLRNAGIGATGSEIGAYRYGKDVSPFKPDLVVFEFGVNDRDEKSADKTLAGLLRHAARDGSAAIVLSMAREDGKDAQDKHLKAAKEYHVPVISYRDAVTPMLKSGAWKWSDIAADGAHPNDSGHGIAAELLNQFIRNEYKISRKDRNARPFLPSPAVTQPYEQGRITPFAQVKLDECVGFVPYDEDRWGKGLMATNVGARISFTFEGGTAAFIYRKGKLPHGRVRVTVDGAPLESTPDGYCDIWWWWTPKQQLVTGCPGRHSVIIETIGKGPSKNAGDGFRLAALLVGP